MRIGLSLLVLLAAAGDSLACFQPDLDNTASGGPVEVTGEGPFKVFTQTVPARPSLYFHQGTDESRPPSTYLDEAGRVIPVVPVYTGIAEYPIRYDLAIERGTFVDSKYRHRHYTVDAAMVPRTRDIHTERWNGYLVVDMLTDAALLRVEEPERTYTISVMGHQVLYFQSETFRITALYGDRREEMLFEARGASPPPERDWTWAVLGALALVAIGLARLVPGPARDASVG